MDELMKNLPIILPIVIIQYTLAIIALVHLIKHPNYRFGNKIFWIIVVLFIQIIGPAAYFFFGRGED